MQKFKTNIKCGGCIQKVKPYLDALKEIKTWNVDINSPDRILIVDGEIDGDIIIKAISKAGYRAEMIQ
jgi:copper chaperone